VILSPEDKEIYFPSVCLEGASLLGAIRIVESIAQSLDGSGRSLELTDYTEEKDLNAFNRSIQLSYFPIVPESLIVKVARFGGTDGFGRKVTNAERTLDTSEYSIEGETLYITQPYYLKKVKVNYRAGFDFTEGTADTIAIKSALGALLQYRQSFAGQGLIRHDGLGLGLNSAKVGENPENLMQIFRQYRPRN